MFGGKFKTIKLNDIKRLCRTSFLLALLYQPQKRAFNRISKKGEASRNICKVRGVWKSDETLFPVFDIS